MLCDHKPIRYARQAGLRQAFSLFNFSNSILMDRTGDVRRMIPCIGLVAQAEYTHSIIDATQRDRVRAMSDAAKLDRHIARI